MKKNASPFAAVFTKTNLTRENYEQSSSSGWHKKRRVRFEFRCGAENWDVSGPHFAGWEIYHVKGSPVDPDRIYASQSSGWFGQIIQRSDNGGKTWNPPGSRPEDLVGPEGFPKGESNKFLYDGAVGTHKWYDGTQHPWEFKRVWHIEPSLTDPDTAFAGVEDAAIFKTTDGGKTWKEFPGLRATKGNLWQPGAGGMAVHTILLDPKNPQRIFVAISAAGAFRTDDGGTTWKPINRGLKSQFELPDPDAEVGHCVHRIALHPSRPDTLFMASITYHLFGRSNGASR